MPGSYQFDCGTPNAACPERSAAACPEIRDALASHPIGQALAPRCPRQTAHLTQRSCNAVFQSRFSDLTTAALAGKPVEPWFTDEARVGQLAALSTPASMDSVVSTLMRYDQSPPRRCWAAGGGPERGRIRRRGSVAHACGSHVRRDALANFYANGCRLRKPNLRKG